MYIIIKKKNKRPDTSPLCHQFLYMRAQYLNLLLSSVWCTHTSVARHRNLSALLNVSHQHWVHIHSFIQILFFVWLFWFCVLWHVALSRLSIPTLKQDHLPSHAHDGAHDATSRLVLLSADLEQQSFRIVSWAESSSKLLASWEHLIQ